MKEAVDEALLVVGASTRGVIYHFLERDHQVKPDQIPDRLESFQDALRGLFGVGATPLEKRIVERFYRKLNLVFEEHADWTLVDYVNHAKQEASNEKLRRRFLARDG